MNKINKKKAGIHSPLFIPTVIILILLFFLGLLIIGRMAVMNREAIAEELRKYDEYIKIEIGTEEITETPTITTALTTTSGTATQTLTTTTTTTNKIKKIVITIENKGKRTSIIDRFVIERWDTRILSRGEINPPIVLGVGEKKEIKGNEILSLFKLNDPAYADNYLFFKENIRCITLHTVLGNTFGSYYSLLKAKTETVRIWQINISATYINQTTTVEYTNPFKLIIESHGPFSFSSLAGDDPHKYEIYDGLYWRIVYGSAIHSTHDDGEYYYSSGSFITVYNSFTGIGSYDLRVRDIYHTIEKQFGNAYANFYTIRQDLIEIDENDNEIRLVKSTTSDSITFRMIRNYKLKRYFGANIVQYPPPPPPPTTATTATQTEETFIDHQDFSYLGKKGTEQHDVIYIYRPSGYSEIKYDHWEVNKGRQWMAKDPEVEPAHDGPDYLRLEVTVYLKENTPDDQGIVLEIYYKLKE